MRKYKLSIFFTILFFSFSRRAPNSCHLSSTRARARTRRPPSTSSPNHTQLQVSLPRALSTAGRTCICTFLFFLITSENDSCCFLTFEAVSSTEELFFVLGPNSVSELFFPDNFYFKFSLALKCQTELSMWELWHHSEQLYVFEVQRNVFTALEDSCLKNINKYMN